MSQLEQTQIVGELDVCDRDGTTMSLSCRYTGVKPKDRLRAWLRHLLLCVEGPEVCTVHIGQKCGAKRRTPRFDNEDPVVMPPLPSDQAREILLRYEALLYRGREETLPFAPATSLAAALGTGKEGSEWHSDFTHAEGDDAYLSHAFGLEGPMTHADFGAVAKAIYRPCLVHLGYAPPKPGGDQ